MHMPLYLELCATTRATYDARINAVSRVRGGIPPPVPPCAAGLLEQPDVLDRHGAIGRLHHVVDREQRHGHGGPRLPLHARPARRRPRPPYPPPREPPRPARPALR